MTNMNPHTPQQWAELDDLFETVEHYALTGDSMDISDIRKLKVALTHFIKGETDRARLDELFLWFPELTGTAQVDTLQISLRSLKNRVAELTTPLGDNNE